MKEKRKIAIVALPVFLTAALVLVVVMIRNICGRTDGRMSERISFQTEWGEEQKQGISEVLQKTYIESDLLCGFCSVEDDFSFTEGLYNIYSVVSLAECIPSYDLSILRERYSFLCNMNCDSFSFDALYFYSYIMKHLGMETDFDIINRRLLDYYDEEEKVFFSSSENEYDIVSVFQNACNMKEALGDKLSEELFSIEDGLKAAFERTVLETDVEKGFYASGAYCFLALKEYGISVDTETDGIEQWLDFWTDYLFNGSYEPSANMLTVSNYVSVAQYLGREKDLEILDDYYNSLTEADIPILLNTLSGELSFVNMDNQRVNAMLTQVLNERIEEGLMNLMIDVRETYYGILMSEKVGFAVNQDKIRNLISKSYEECENWTRAASVCADQLYYTILLDEYVNAGNMSVNDAYYQSMVDYFLDGEILCYDEDLFGEIYATREILEGAAFLSNIGYDIHVTAGQRHRIKKKLKSILEDEDTRNDLFGSGYISDLYYIGMMVSGNFVKKKDIVKTYDDMLSKKDTDYGISLYELYKIYPLLKEIGYEDRETQVSLLDDFRTGGWEYAFYKEEPNNINLSSIAYGLWLSELLAQQ